MSDPQSTTCGGTGNDGEFNGVDGTCLRGHATIDVTVTVPFAVGLGPVTQALAEWNAMLAHVPQMPALRIVDSGGIPLVVHSNASSYCGRTSGGTGGKASIVNVWEASHSQCFGAKSADLTTVITHELAHVLGWNSAHGGYPGSLTSLTQDCATFTADPADTGPLSGNVCLHDVEALFRARLNSNGWPYDPDYFSTPILWTTNAPGHDSIPASSVAQIPMTQWVPLPGTPVNRSHTHLSWVESTALFSVDGSGNVTTGSTLGSGKLYLKATSSPPSGYLVWTPFKEKGDSVTVTVIPAGPFVIDSVTASGMDTLPYLTGGERLFIAWISNAPAGNLETEWHFVVPGVGADTVGAWGNGKYWDVPAGEYGLEVRVRAHVGSTWSGSGFTTVYFPVCIVEPFAECPM